MAGKMTAIERSEQLRVGARGKRMLRLVWSPPEPIKGTVLVVHGIGEHSGRYEHVAQHLGRAGYAVRAFDLEGHGKSDGKRGHLRFADVFEDIDELLREDGGRAETTRRFLYGHSLGGLLVLAYAFDRRPALTGIVSSGPALHTALREQRAKVFAARLLGRLMPTLTLPTGLDDAYLTRDAAVLEAYRADPLVHDKASVGLGRDALIAMDRVLGATELSAPLLVVHGRADRINYPSGSEVLAARLGARCTLRVYDDVLHEPHNDPDSQRILNDVVTWLDARSAR
jgi:alpha-beta hydrolase superfamily lysophospholipase